MPTLVTRPLDAIHQLTALQAGHVARWQLVGMGIPHRWADDALSEAGLVASHPGVRRAPGAPQNPAADMWSVVLAAASRHRRARPPDGERFTVVSAHEAARNAYGVTAFSAAWIRRLTSTCPPRTHLLLPHSSRSAVLGCRPIRTRRPIGPLDGRTGVPAVGPLRMLWDCAQVLPRDDEGISRMLDVAGKADARRLVSGRELHWAARAPQTFGLPLVVPEVFRIAAFRMARQFSHSASEARARAIATEVAAALGLRVEPHPLPLPDASHPIAEADIAIVAIRLDLEVDGPHHDDPAQRRRDRWRDRGLREIRWRTCRYSAEQVMEDPGWFRRVVEADILEAAAAAGVAVPCHR